MARWGEGDPRWIVEERPDAVNVNNWHWVEKDATQWSKDTITELLTNLIVEDDTAYCKVKEVKKIEGEATANNRKGKLIFFYELVVEADWIGHLKDDGKSTDYKGTISIPNLSEENEADELDVEVTMKKDTSEAYRVKEVMRTKGVPEIQNKLSQFIFRLKKEYSIGIILPTKDNVVSPKQPDKPKLTVNKVKEEMNKLVVNGQGDTTKPLGVRIHTKTIRHSENFQCRAEDLYKSLTVKEMVQAFTGGSVEMEVEKGGHFTIYSGAVTGEFVELVPDKKLVQRWRFKSWPAEHYSQVTMEFVQKDDHTVLKLTQTGVPDTEYDRTIDGWKQHYWERMRMTFGFGSRIF